MFESAEDRSLSIREFREAPTVMSVFPLRYASGAKWETFKVRCSECEKEIEEDCVRGRVEILRNTTYRVEHVDAYVIDAHAYCEACNLFTPVRYFLPESLDLVGIDRRDGRWWLSIYERDPQTTWGRFKRWVKRLWSRSKKDPKS